MIEAAVNINVWGFNIARWKKSSLQETRMMWNLTYFINLILNNIYSGMPSSARLVWMYSWWKEKTTQKAITDKKYNN